MRLTVLKSQKTIPKLPSIGEIFIIHFYTRYDFEIICLRHKWKIYSFHELNISTNFVKYKLKWTWILQDQHRCKSINNLSKLDSCQSQVQFNLIFIFHSNPHHRNSGYHICWLYQRKAHEKQIVDKLLTNKKVPFNFID